MSALLQKADIDLIKLDVRLGSIADFKADIRSVKNPGLGVRGFLVRSSGVRS
jgi:hypothetical protein